MAEHQYTDETFFNRTQAAQYVAGRWGVPLSRATLAKWAVTGGGPPFRKVGRCPIYSKADLDVWVTNRMSPLVTSTSFLRWR